MKGEGSTICEVYLGSLAACITPSIILHATSSGIQIDSINIDVKAGVNLLGFTCIDANLGPRAQQFRTKLKIRSINATEEQLNGLYKTGKKFSPAFYTLTNGTEVIIIGS